MQELLTFVAKSLVDHPDQVVVRETEAEAIIRSMTPRERRNPSVLNASRRKRIAAGSGTTVQDVNQLIRQFEQAKEMMKRMTSQMKGGRAQRMMRKFPGMR